MGRVRPRRLHPCSSEGAGSHSSEALDFALFDNGPSQHLHCLLSGAALTADVYLGCFSEMQTQWLPEHVASPNRSWRRCRQTRTSSGWASRTRGTCTTTTPRWSRTSWTPRTCPSRTTPSSATGTSTKRICRQGRRVHHVQDCWRMYCNTDQMSCVRLQLRVRSCTMDTVSAQEHPSGTA